MDVSRTPKLISFLFMMESFPSIRVGLDVGCSWMMFKGCIFLDDYGVAV